MLANWLVKAFQRHFGIGFNIWEPEGNSVRSERATGSHGRHSSAENRRHSVARIHGSGTFRVMNEIVGVLLLAVAYSRANVS